jgi:hypothetical protein
MFLSVFLSAIVLAFAGVPFAIGIFQAIAGIRMALRATYGLASLVAAAIGVAVGVLFLPGATFNPGTDSPADAWRPLLGLMLIVANVAAMVLLVRSQRHAPTST